MAASEPENRKLFTIILATFNCGQKIENTLRSIFSQNRELFEVIILDNLSTDDTLDHIRKYENDLTLISQKDNGIYDAFNKGIDLAKGKYIYFIGAGDCLKPEILETIKEFLPLEKPAFVYGKCYFTKHKVLNGKEFTAKLFVRDNLCHQGIFYHRDIFNIVGKYDLQYKILSDWFFNLKCFIHDGITKKYVDCVVADYEENGVSSEITCDPVFLKEFPVFVKKQFGFYNYFLCKAFLKNPLLFNYIYYTQYYMLLIFLASKFPFLNYAVSFAKPYVQKHRNRKNTGKCDV